MTETAVRMILGDEGLLVQEAEQRAVSEAFGGAAPGFNHAVFSAAGGAEAALDLARTQPMMARRRVVVIRDLEKASVELLDVLAAYVESPNPSTLLLLVGSKLPEATGGVDRGRRLENRLKKTDAVLRFQAKDQHPIAFATEQAALLGCKLDRRAAELLVELVGSDLGRLRMEVAKAAAWLGGAGLIDVVAVEAVSSPVAEAVVWDLTDAILVGDINRALTTTHRMLEDAGPGDGASHRLLALVTWQVRRVLELQSGLRSGAGVPESWQRMPANKLRQAQDTLRRRPIDPAAILETLSRANRDFNRSPAGDRRIFEALVLELCAR
jgi:DNA polymerase III delta subunit